MTRDSDSRPTGRDRRARGEARQSGGAAASPERRANRPGDTIGEGERELSDEAIIVAFGWFSFGAKASVTSNPPHANMKARQPALDELLAAKLITHEHEYHKRHRIDRHHFKGTHGIMDMLGTERAKAVLANALRARTASSTREGL